MIYRMRRPARGRGSGVSAKVGFSRPRGKWDVAPHGGGEECESAKVRKCGVALPFSPLRILVPRPIRVYPREPKTFGEHVRRKRMALGLTQGALAEHLGVVRDCISLWERNRKIPRGPRLSAVTAFLGYDPRIAAAA